MGSSLRRAASEGGIDEMDGLQCQKGQGVIRMMPWLTYNYPTPHRYHFQRVRVPRGA